MGGSGLHTLGGQPDLNVQVFSKVLINWLLVYYFLKEVKESYRSNLIFKNLQFTQIKINIHTQIKINIHTHILTSVL